MNKYTMIDENNNVFTTTYKSARRFFELHGGNSVVIIYSNGASEKFERLPDGKIIKKYCRIPASVKKQKYLFIFCFETGDSSCLYWEEAVIIKTTSLKNTANLLEDAFLSYYESLNAKDSNTVYSEDVEAVLNSLDLEWEGFKHEGSQTVNGYKIMYI